MFLEVFVEILNGCTGRLYKSLVEGQEIAANARVGQDSRKYAGAFSFNGQVKGDATPAALEKAFYAVLQGVGAEPIPDAELQKVKNRVQANSFRRLEDNFYLMVQLGYYEGLGGWEYINESPKELSAVTSDDVHRVMKKYFTKGNRAVAVYTRKAGTKAAPVDPELAALQGQGRQIAEQSVKQINMISDAKALRAQIGMMEQRAPAAPPQLKPAIDYILKKAKQRLAELEKK